MGKYIAIDVEGNVMSDKQCKKCGGVTGGWKHSYNSNIPQISIECLQKQIDQLFGIIGDLEKRLKDKDSV